jgi:hypothetical protein
MHLGRLIFFLSIPIEVLQSSSVGKLKNFDRIVSDYLFKAMKVRKEITATAAAKSLGSLAQRISAFKWPALEKNRNLIFFVEHHGDANGLDDVLIQHVD